MPVSLPALARAEKYVSRLERNGRADLLDLELPGTDLTPYDTI